MNFLFFIYIPITIIVMTGCTLHTADVTGNSILVYVTVATSFFILFFLGTIFVVSTTVYKIKKSRGSLE